MNAVDSAQAHAMSRITLAMVFGIAASTLSLAPGTASPADGGPSPTTGDGKCAMDIVLETTPRFTQRLPCRFSNDGQSKSDSLIWNTPKNSAGVVVSLATGQRTADSATLSVFDDKIPRADSADNSNVMPIAGYEYALDSSSKTGWSGVVDVFPTPRDVAPVECQGGYYGNSALPRPYVTATVLRLNWAVVDQGANVIRGTARAQLSCAKINLHGPRTPLGLIGTLVATF